VYLVNVEDPLLTGKPVYDSVFARPYTY